jgi:D-arabinose 1-dehydrogenase-like Zn-dependent alcohol dehydrogenase
MRQSDRPALSAPGNWRPGGPTAYCMLKVAQARRVEVYVSTRSPRNMKAARREGARWAANAAKEEMPCKLDAAILFPPAGELVKQRKLPQPNTVIKIAGSA